jgi:tetratricopeptide (TPR) repeat protein
MKSRRNTKNAALFKARKWIQIGASLFALKKTQDSILPLKRSLKALQIVLGVKIKKVMHVLTYLDNKDKYPEMFDILENAMNVLSENPWKTIHVPDDFVGWSYCIIGNILVSVGNPKLAIEYYSIGLTCLRNALGEEQLADNLTYAIFLINEGHSLSQVGYYVQGRNVLNQALVVCANVFQSLLEMSDYKEVVYQESMIYIYLATGFMDEAVCADDNDKGGMFNQAIQHLKRGYDLSKSIQFKIANISCQVSYIICEKLGTCHSHMGNYEAAFKHFQEAYRARHGGRTEKADIAGKVGLSLSYLCDFKASVSWLGKSLDLKKDILSSYNESNPKWIIDAIIDYIPTLLQLHKYEKCVELIMEAFQLEQNIPPNHEIHGVLTLFLSSCSNFMRQSEKAIIIIKNMITEEVIEHHSDLDIANALDTANRYYVHRAYVAAHPFAQEALELTGPSNHTNKTMATILHLQIVSKLRYQPRAIEHLGPEFDKKLDYTYTVLCYCAIHQVCANWALNAQIGLLLKFRQTDSYTLLNVLEHVRLSHASFKSIARAMKQVAILMAKKYQFDMAIAVLTYALDLITDTSDFEAKALLFAARANCLQVAGKVELVEYMFKNARIWIGKDFDRLEHGPEDYKAAHLIRGICFNEEDGGERQIEQVIKWSLQHHKHRDFTESLKRQINDIIFGEEEEGFFMEVEHIVTMDQQYLNLQAKARFNTFYNNRMIDFRRRHALRQEQLAQQNVRNED